MNLRSELSSLSPWVYCWFVTILVLWCLSFLWMWQFSIACTLFVIPFIWLIYWWSRNKHCSLNHVLKPFLHGYINMTCLAVLCQMVGLVVISILFAATGALTFSAGNLLFLVLSIWYYVTVEELLKLFFSLKSRDSLDDPIHQITKVHTITSTATALGYSMCTGTIWTFFVSIALARDDAADHEKYSLFGWLFLVSLIIAVIGMPMHLITGYTTGCKITQKDLEWADVHRNDTEDGIENNPAGRNRLPFRRYISAVYSNIAVRSAYLFFIVIGFLVIQFNIVGVIISLLGIVLDYALLIYLAKKVESQLPFDYLQRAGQLSMFGYNVLEDQPVEEEQVRLSAAEDLGNDLDLNENQVVVTAVNMGQFAVDQKMKVGQYAVGQGQDAVVVANEDHRAEERPVGGGLKVPDNVLEDSNSNTDEDVR